jgi:L-fucose mutarotase
MWVRTFRKTTGKAAGEIRGQGYRAAFQVMTKGGGNVLKTVDLSLNADVPYALRAMGHGDRLVICDTNFPADFIARQTALGRLLRIDNAKAATAVAAVLSVLSLDTVDDAAIRMEVVSSPKEVRAVEREVLAVIDRAQSNPGRSSVSSAMPSMRRGRPPVGDRNGRAPLLRVLPAHQGVVPPDEERWRFNSRVSNRACPFTAVLESSHAPR